MIKLKRKMKKKSQVIIIGLDEVGRGPLAGPVVAVAVKIRRSTISYFRCTESILLAFSKKGRIMPKFSDSKKLTPKVREKIYKILINHSCVDWGIGIVSEKKIDNINILEATKLAMEKALKKIDCKGSLLIIDGNFKINIDYNQKSIIKADEKILECSLSSIIAKVMRDKMMEKYHKKYPEYGFNKNKGYGTKKHIEAIKKYGLCPIHRKSFKIKN